VMPAAAAVMPLPALLRQRPARRQGIAPLRGEDAFCVL